MLSKHVTKFCKVPSLRKQPTFRDVFTGFPDFIWRGNQWRRLFSQATKGLLHHPPAFMCSNSWQLGLIYIIFTTFLYWVLNLKNPVWYLCFVVGYFHCFSQFCKLAVQFFLLAFQLCHFLSYIHKSLNNTTHHSHSSSIGLRYSVTTS